MDVLQYTREQLIAEPPAVMPNVIAGRLFHGSVDDTGRYFSPRLHYRRPAVDCWSRALRLQSGELIDIALDGFGANSIPSTAQQALLLSAGICQPLFDAFTEMSDVERRAGRLHNVKVFEFADIVVEDISSSALGHLNLGLIEAHGLDEGGDPQNPQIGGHDKMWLAVRDLILPCCENAPLVFEKPSDVSPSLVIQEFAIIPSEFEFTIRFLVDILVSEIRADLFFNYCESLFEFPLIFLNHEKAVRDAQTIVRYIRADEKIHVDYLRLAISEMRALSFRTLDGKILSGSSLIDSVWTKACDKHKEAHEIQNRHREKCIEAYLSDLQIPFDIGLYQSMKNANLDKGVIELIKSSI
jgi:hypothetical protein